MPVLIHVLHVRYWLAYASVQMIANAISFTLYKYWAFQAGGGITGQYARQLIIFGGSWGLNTALPSWFAYRMGIQPVLAFALSNVIVYFGWNYPGNRYWVFRGSLYGDPSRRN